MGQLIAVISLSNKTASHAVSTETNVRGAAPVTSVSTSLSPMEGSTTAQGDSVMEKPASTNAIVHTLTLAPLPSSEC